MGKRNLPRSKKRKEDRLVSVDKTVKECKRGEEKDRVRERREKGRQRKEAKLCPQAYCSFASDRTD